MGHAWGLCLRGAQPGEGCGGSAETGEFSTDLNLIWGVLHIFDEVFYFYLSPVTPTRKRFLQHTAFPSTSPH